MREQFKIKKQSPFKCTKLIWCIISSMFMVIDLTLLGIYASADTGSIDYICSREATTKWINWAIIIGCGHSVLCFFKIFSFMEGFKKYCYKETEDDYNGGTNSCIKTLYTSTFAADIFFYYWCLSGIKVINETFADFCVDSTIGQIIFIWCILRLITASIDVIFILFDGINCVYEMVTLRRELNKYETTSRIE
eukprot:497682_1